MTTWQPNYRRDLKWRLTAAAEIARDHPKSPKQIEYAITAVLGAFSPMQFPADFRTQFLDVMELGMKVKDMNDTDLASTVQKITELHRDVLS